LIDCRAFFEKLAGLAGLAGSNPVYARYFIFYFSFRKEKMKYTLPILQTPPI
jgi:hypothetical protein